MTLDTQIELLNLADIAIKLITCPNRVYSPDEAAHHLSTRADVHITAAMFMDFRAKFIKGMVKLDELPKPILHKSEVLGSARNIYELMSYSQLDTLGLRNGISAEAFDIFFDAKQQGKLRDATGALRLILESAESIDKKLKAISGDDPAADILGSQAFKSLKEALLRVHKTYPDFDLLGKLKLAMAETEDIASIINPEALS